MSESLEQIRARHEALIDEYGECEDEAREAEIRRELAVLEAAIISQMEPDAAP
jgi:hypothetical protein